MFDNLSDRLSGTLKRLRGQGRLTEKNIKDALREVRMALLEADVALPVVRTFIDTVRSRAVGQEVNIASGQEVKILAMAERVNELTVTIADITGKQISLKMLSTFEK